MLCFSSPTLRTGAFIYTADIVELFLSLQHILARQKQSTRKKTG